MPLPKGTYAGITGLGEVDWWKPRPPIPKRTRETQEDG